MPTSGDVLIPWLVFLGFVCYFGAESLFARFRGARRDSRRALDAGSFVVNVAGFIVGLGLALGARVFVDALAAPGSREAWGVAGSIVCAVGAMVRGSAVWTLGRSYSPVVAIQPGQAIVTSGPYRFVRHPAYTGVLLMVAGIGLATGNLGSLAACVIFPGAAIFNRLRVEEPVLERELGEEYRRYARGKKRLLPGIW